MRTPYIISAVLICTLPWMAHATTLQEAMQMAGESHPTLRMANSQVQAAQSQLQEQSAYGYNPELSLEPQTRRLNGGGKATDYYISLSQGIELGGKTGYRAQAAQAALDSRSQQAEQLRRQLQIDAARAYVQLSFAKSMLEVPEMQGKLMLDLNAAVRRQLEVGDANVLQANLANAAYISALNAETEARQRYTLAQAAFDVAVGDVALQTEHRIALQLPHLRMDWQAPAQALRLALETRADVAALQAELRQAQAQADLAAADRIPDPTVSLMTGREAGEQLVKLGVTFALPVWNSHQGAYQAALANASFNQDKLAWFEKRLQREVQAALRNHQYAFAALTQTLRLEQSSQAVGNIALAKTAFKAGELSLEDLVIHINQALNARLTALNIKKQAWLARIRLAEVLGHPEYILEGAKL